MTSSSNKCSNIQEIVAHTSKVTCVTLGQNSGRVMATGGQDKKVNLWTTDKPNCLMTLSGHTSGVECVQFNKSEELIAAGSSSGCLKVWNLEQCKIVRTLSGHKSNVKTIDFHPWTDRYILSGSNDTNIKFWDIERKACVYSYRGHSAGINCVQFSPDGRWFCSGSDDSTVRIFDITSGKQISQLSANAAVKAVAFHPNEFLLCFATADRTLTFWDIDVFKSLGSSKSSDTTSDYKCVKFHSTENCVYAACNDYLKVYSWEPNEYLDSVKTGWGNLSDLAFCKDYIVGVSHSGTNVATYQVTQSLLRPNASNDDRENFEKELIEKHKPFKRDDKPTRPKKSHQGTPPVQKLYTPKKPDKETKETENKFKVKVLKEDPTKNILKIEHKAEPNSNIEPIEDKDVMNVEPMINMSDFMPKTNSDANASRAEIPASLIKGHSSMIEALQARAKNLQIVRVLWSAGNIRTSIETAIGMKDPSIIVDLLEIVLKKNSLWTLDLAVIILPSLIELLNSKYENHVLVSLTSVRTILQCFASVIKANISTPPSSNSVDISREERFQRCKECNSLLLKVRSIIDSPKQSKYLTKSASKLREVKFLFKQLD
ncbi:DgyrCDS9934 [Dimorphilus gyrociliatus]|uniref:Katanin p80 WD40 repeat-containing subunit B1 n=1 Tax=Dimorphilus gyrociliatus TaxID=2664684 RepID=A0A7I8VZW9_9ANNE|nr:DgyrCDS9934 [Dimorphilus gyrociliatus]